MATLATPPRIRELQRALYRRAKAEPKFRFYSLYDKVYPLDVLAHAYAVARANRGAPGPDNVTFEEIEMRGLSALLEELHNALKDKTYRPGPVRRVYVPKPNGEERPLGIPNIRDRVVQTAVKLILEPIFEANFDDDSFGFRPKRGAHDALDAIEEALTDGMSWVIDADITAYFDSIPHDRLMKAVGERVADGSVLTMLKLFLEAPIVDEEQGDNRPRRNRQGTPQGGVVSPLLANIYLNLMDRNFRKQVAAGNLEGRLVRYSDDFVVLTRQRPDRELAWIHGILGRLGLTLHPEKTRVLHMQNANFAFLGHQINWRLGRMYLDVSKKAQGRIHEQLRRRTRWPGLSLEDVINWLNKYIRGARRYFCRVRRRTLSKLDFYVEGRIARWWAKKHSKPRPAWSLVRGGALRLNNGLERWWFPRVLIPTTSKIR